MGLLRPLVWFLRCYQKTCETLVWKKLFVFCLFKLIYSSQQSLETSNVSNLIMNFQKMFPHTSSIYKMMRRKIFQWVENGYKYRKGHSTKLLFCFMYFRKIQWKFLSFHNVSKKNYYEQLSLVLNEARVLSIIDFQVGN